MIILRVSTNLKNPLYPSSGPALHERVAYTLTHRVDVGSIELFPYIYVNGQSSESGVEVRLAEASSAQAFQVFDILQESHGFNCAWMESDIGIGYKGCILKHPAHPDAADTWLDRVSL